MTTLAPMPHYLRKVMSMLFSTCTHCGTRIHTYSRGPHQGEWHAEPNALGVHYVNVCGASAGGHAPTTTYNIERTDTGFNVMRDGSVIASPRSHIDARRVANLDAFARMLALPYPASEG